MHRALHIPEIVAQIIECNRFHFRCLYNTLLVNSLFFYSSARILWSECGVGSSKKGHIVPYIRHLVQIARQDAHRGQMYAALIRRLEIRDGMVFEENNGFLVGQKNETELACLEELSEFDMKWTNLEEVDALQSDGWREELQKPLMQCLQPRLKIFSMDLKIIVGDEFLDTLAKRCPELKCLALKPYFGRDGITISGLARFLEKCRLESINFRAEEYTWGVVLEKEIFEVLHKQSKLRHISVPDISDITLENIASTRIPTDRGAFPALKSLCSGLTVSALRSLHSVTPHLSNLSLDLCRLPILATTSILSSISMFSNLAELDITYSRYSGVLGHELVHLAQNCPFLCKLSITKDEQMPWSLDIKDSHIEAFAQNAIHLKELFLVFRVPKDFDAWKWYPTEAALESLARHCSRLERLWLTSDPDWKQLTRHPLSVLFPNLWDLQIDGPQMVMSFTEFEKRADLENMAANIVVRLPSLTNFKFIGSYGERAWEEMVKDVLRAKRFEVA